MAPPYAGLPAAQGPKGGRPAPSRNLWIIALPVVAGSVMLAMLVVFLVIPLVLKSRCIAAAAERGITLSVDHVDIGLGEVRLVKLGFALDGVPQLSAHADDAQVALSGLAPGDSTIHGLVLALDGPVEDVQRAADAWRAVQAKLSRADGAGGQKVAFTQAHLTWTRVFGQTAKIETTDADGDVAPAAGSVHVTAEHVSLTAGQAVFGPWRTTLERDAQQTRTDIELDPVVHGGPAIVYVKTAAGAASVKVNVPASPLSRIGVPPKTVKLGSDPQVEAQIDFEETVAGASTLAASLSLSRAVFSGMPVDAVLHLQAAGDVTRGLDVKQGTLTAGPLDASVSGTVKIFDDGARVALAWTAKPVPCAQMGKQLATRELGQLGALAQDVGDIVGLRVTGDAHASGLITLDSRDVSATSFTMTSNETCGLALF